MKLTPGAKDTCPVTYQLLKATFAVAAKELTEQVTVRTMISPNENFRDSLHWIKQAFT
jgi:hypothetical protein